MGLHYKEEDVVSIHFICLAGRQVHSFGDMGKEVTKKVHFEILRRCVAIYFSSFTVT